MSPRHIAPPEPAPEPVEPPTDGQTPPDTPDPSEEPTEAAEEPQDDEQGDDRPGREAAKYRRRLRATEAERDALRAQVETMQRAEVERVAGQTLTRPSALWRAGVELADVLAEDGTVDPAKVSAAVVRAAEELGLTRHRPGNVPTQGTGTKVPPPDPDADMLAVLQGRH